MNSRSAGMNRTPFLPSCRSSTVICWRKARSSTLDERGIAVGGTDKRMAVIGTGQGRWNSGIPHPGGGATPPTMKAETCLTKVDS